MNDDNDHGASLRSQEAGSSAETVAVPNSHTPGPWEARWGCSAICVGDQTLARVYWDEGRSAAVNEANAHLIAAAPELLDYAKLERDIDDFDCQHDAEERCKCGQIVHQMIERAAAMRTRLIAKAEGQS